MTPFFQFFDSLELHLWGYIGFPLILFFGGYLTWKSKCLQIRRLPSIMREFFGYFRRDAVQSAPSTGLLPLKALVASIGGCLGIGNLVNIAIAMHIGGPGALFWLWMTAILGSVVKYSEVFTALRHRRLQADGSYRGGPMYYLKDAFGSNIPALIFCVLLSLYGVEVYQFNVVATVAATSLGCPKILTVVILMLLVFVAAKGGLRRVSSVASFLVPIFICLYLLMGGWVLFNYASLIPQLFVDIFQSAFTQRAAEGGFVGSVFMITLTQGIRRACYSADIGVGYASIIHSESNNPSPIKQARLVIVEVFIDIFCICSMSAMLVLITGTWKSTLMPFQMVQEALATHFPYMQFFMPFLIFLLGYSTVLTYLSAGLKSAVYISPRYGKRIFGLYAFFAFFLFSFADTALALTAMSLIQFCLLILNLTGIFVLRKGLVFDEQKNVLVPEKATI